MKGEKDRNWNRWDQSISPGIPSSSCLKCAPTVNMKTTAMRSLVTKTRKKANKNRVSDSTYSDRRPHWRESTVVASSKFKTCPHYPTTTTSVADWKKKPNLRLFDLILFRVSPFFPRNFPFFGTPPWLHARIGVSFPQNRISLIGSLNSRFCFVAKAGKESWGKWKKRG